ncbi:MAG: hypothetical protein QNK30_08570, partial [Bacteroidales bacterium]|nr:hypothetical protein [Bacteroidales bacterium]
ILLVVSRWLRKSDKEMIKLEQVYMRLLIENKEKLMHSWGLQQQESFASPKTLLFPQELLIHRPSRKYDLNTH